MMSGDLQLFKFEHQAIRVVVIDDDPWFVAFDVARALGYRDTHNLTRRVDDDEKGTHSVSTPGGDQAVVIISESGLYAAIFGSQIDGAHKFKRWVTHKVLPEIRRSGSYSHQPAIGQQLPSKKELAQWVIEAEERAERAEAKVLELTPPAQAWNELAEAAGDYAVADAAKVLSRDPNISTGERRLFSFMAAEGWVYRGGPGNRLHAYQSQVECGRLVEKVGKSFWHQGRGEWVAPNPVIRITPKGLQELHKRLGGSDGPDEGGQLALVGAS